MLVVLRTNAKGGQKVSENNIGAAWSEKARLRGNARRVKSQRFSDGNLSEPSRTDLL